jgi:hypothetical protein
MVWVIAMIIRTIRTFRPTKHMNNKYHICLKSTCQKNKTRASCYTKYSLGDFLFMDFLYPFVGPTSCVCSIPLGFLHHLIHLLGIWTHVHVVCRQFQSMSYLPQPPPPPHPCFIPRVHTRSMFEKGDFARFWTCIDCDLGIQPMLVKKVHMHYLLLALNYYY